MKAVGRMKEIWQQYGKAAVVTYMALYWSLLGAIYLAIDAEVISASLVGFENNEDCIRKVISISIYLSTYIHCL